MTREEAKALVILQTQFAEFLRREAERDQREAEQKAQQAEREAARDGKINEMYDMLRWVRGFWLVTKWFGVVGAALYVAAKTGDWSDLLRAFGR